jgi:2-methylcitrate dehydratase PrpD
MDSVFLLSGNVFQNDFDSLPPKTIDATKRVILDSLGVALAGRRSRECALVIEMAQYWKGRTESTIIGVKERAPSPVAALVNGTMIQALDFDETHDLSGAHSASCVLPAALVLGETKKVSGRQLISAVALGIDLACRLGTACEEKIGWTSTSVYGCFGAAAAAAKILDLPQDKIRHSLGIVFSQASGTSQTAIDTPLSKHMQSGFASKAGVLSALLAERGTSGVQNVFEGKFGFFNLYKSGKYRRELLLKDLGTCFEVDALSLKPFPCCRATHGPIEAVSLLLKESTIRTEEIASIEVTVPEVAYDLVGRPFAPGENPVISAQFSISYTVAALLVFGRVSLDAFNPEVICNPRMHDLMKRIKVEAEARNKTDGFAPATVRIKTEKGVVHSRTVEKLRGHPDQPLGDDELLAKFRSCVKFGTPEMSEKETNRLADMLLNLEAIKDIGGLTKALRFDVVQEKAVR